MSEPQETEPPATSCEDSTIDVVREVLRVALPLMISTGTFSLVLFADRTFLLWYKDGAAMSASMAAGNLFWSTVCVPVGIASMTGAIISQYVGANEPAKVGRFLWQAVWYALLTLPFFGFVALFTRTVFQWTGQPADLIDMESTYLRLLLIGSGGIVMDAGLGGFFAGTERTRVIMWASIATGILNVVLDYGLIFGVRIGPLAIPAMGIVGAGLASLISFWFKALLFASLLLAPRFESVYQIRSGFGIDGPMLKKLFFFGLPSGLMSLTEAGGFTAIMLTIGSLGDVPLRATTMAINFNMIAFIPLVGMSIAASVLVGRHLLESGPRRALRSVLAALSIGWLYSLAWGIIYLMLPDELLSMYQWRETSEASNEAIRLASGLLSFVAIYLLADATQLIIAGALRGAGDTWFVLFSGLAASVVACTVGWFFEPTTDRLTWWWWVVTAWVFLLAASMTGRFLQGRWKTMRMV